MKTIIQLTKILALAALASVAAPASAEMLDFASQLEGHVVRVMPNPYNTSKCITDYKVTDYGSQRVHFKITATYGDLTTHSWDFFLEPGGNYDFYWDTCTVFAVNAIVYSRG
ncbi:MAG: hypothetical protein ABSH48_21420 [Verrucomicrobiota bacterium]|jgi:hypothetical protein